MVCAAAVVECGGMPNYRRAWVPGGTTSSPYNLLERDRRLLVDHVDDLRDAFRKACLARPFEDACGRGLAGSPALLVALAAW